MPVLNEAKGVKLGTVPVQAIYKGTALIGRVMMNHARNPTFRTTISATGITPFNGSNSTRAWNAAGYDVGAFTWTHTVAASTGVICSLAVPVLAGQTITALAKVKSPVGIGVSLSIRTSGGGGVSYVASTGNAGWQEVRTSAVAASDGALTGMQITTNTAIGTTIWADQFVLMVGNAPYIGNYRDGNSAGWVWDGTPDASTSSGWA